MNPNSLEFTAEVCPTSVEAVCVMTRKERGVLCRACARGLGFRV
jgi:hypothetical protein